MNKRIIFNFTFAAALFVIFGIFTALVATVDVQTLGPEGSAIGFATINYAFFNKVGSTFILYTVTDWLGLVAIAVAIGFAVFGLCQLIKRKSLKKVDYQILILGGFYLAVACAYLIFEKFIVNYRPILIDGYLEASYPSSHTLAVYCIMTTAGMLFLHYISNKPLQIALITFSVVFTLFIIIGRLISGAHWLTDIIGGLLLGSALIFTYYAFVKLVDYKQAQKLT